jgi:SAM-dependent methyltransferase
VSAVDFAPGMLSRAREKAEAEGAAVDWAEGDAQALPYEDVAFDAVASCFGVIFAPNARAAAGELGRVCRPGGRLGLTVWRPNAGLHSIYSTYRGEEASGEPADEWGEPERVRALLDHAFELAFEERTWTLEGDSPEDVWELMTSSAPPVKALVESLEPERLADFRAAMLDYWAGFETGGRVVEPRGYLLVTGRRR